MDLKSHIKICNYKKQFDHKKSYLIIQDFTLTRQMTRTNSKVAGRERV